VEPPLRPTSGSTGDWDIRFETAPVMPLLNPNNISEVYDEMIGDDDWKNIQHDWDHVQHY
jgi:hypothetical protein